MNVIGTQKRTTGDHAVWTVKGSSWWADGNRQVFVFNPVRFHLNMDSCETSFCKSVKSEKFHSGFSDGTFFEALITSFTCCSSSLPFFTLLTTKTRSATSNNNLPVQLNMSNHFSTFPFCQFTLNDCASNRARVSPDASCMQISFSGIFCTPVFHWLYTELIWVNFCFY